MRTTDNSARHRSPSRRTRRRKRGSYSHRGRGRLLQGEGSIGDQEQDLGERRDIDTGSGEGARHRIGPDKEDLGWFVVPWRGAATSIGAGRMTPTRRVPRLDSLTVIRPAPVPTVVSAR